MNHASKMSHHFIPSRFRIAQKSAIRLSVAPPLHCMLVVVPDRKCNSPRLISLTAPPHVCMPRHHIVCMPRRILLRLYLDNRCSVRHDYYMKNDCLVEGNTAKILAKLCNASVIVYDPCLSSALSHSFLSLYLHNLCVFFLA